MKKSFSSSSVVSLLKPSFSSDRVLLILSPSKVVIDHKEYEAKPVEAHLPILQTVEKHYVAAIKYQICRLFNQFPCYYETVSSYITKLVMKVRLQMKVHFFNPIDQILVNSSLSTVKHDRDANHIYEGAAI